MSFRHLPNTVKILCLVGHKFTGVGVDGLHDKDLEHVALLENKIASIDFRKFRGSSVTYVELAKKHFESIDLPAILGLCTFLMSHHFLCIISTLFVKSIRRFWIVGGRADKQQDSESGAYGIRHPTTVVHRSKSAIRSFGWKSSGLQIVHALEGVAIPGGVCKTSIDRPHSAASFPVLRNFTARKYLEEISACGSFGIPTRCCILSITLNVMKEYAVPICVCKLI